eukprot:CAMPEP_0185574028 /NCGR_PEP_ID=MMETSP0434-20130131/5587_1 /TAXON_ID=626734 ORGANISM="Favella taraikaensis, Strain Fe Narragansett Bay" /NCGR_SAMPLE_ID=MMETSP0434 /ASSEMBLY_ACC=CAM_ASM_000379 /LENGTH=38 /DNA_ID= /DNA_START= /DNA_END= /DNA_ORIENTATION=
MELFRSYLAWGSKFDIDYRREKPDIVESYGVGKTGYVV